jgi:hypothetical protein
MTCICGNNLLAPSCCLQRDGSWRKTPSDCIPPAPQTGIAQPQCYAATLCDCSSKMSDEHLIPESILRKQSSSGINTVSGFVFSHGSPDDIPAKRLVARVLCARHNNALSPLDAEALRLFTAFFDFNLKADAHTSETRLFSGEDIERFMLKSYCAMVASGNAWTIDPTDDRAIDPSFVEMVFGNETIPPACGMRLAVPQRGQIGYSGDFGIGPTRMAIDDGTIMGLCMLMGGFRFDVFPTFPAVPAGHSYWRPGSIVLTRGTAVKTILFSWDDGQEHPAVHLHADSVDED